MAGLQKLDTGVRLLCGLAQRPRVWSAGAAVSDGLADASVKEAATAMQHVLTLTGNHTTAGLPLGGWEIFILTTGTILIYVNDMIWYGYDSHTNS